MASQIEALRALTAQMYAHTSAAVRASQVTARSQSETFVKQAPVRKLGPYEQQARLERVTRDIAETILNSEPSAEAIREKLSHWNGARVR
jgi:hypothetical protein